jgi:hypothetical protein
MWPVVSLMLYSSSLGKSDQVSSLNLSEMRGLDRNDAK